MTTLINAPEKFVPGTIELYVTSDVSDKKANEKEYQLVKVCPIFNGEVLRSLIAAIEHEIGGYAVADEPSRTDLGFYNAGLEAVKVH